MTNLIWRWMYCLRILVHKEILIKYLNLWVFTLSVERLIKHYCGVRHDQDLQYWTWTQPNRSKLQLLFSLKIIKHVLTFSLIRLGISYRSERHEFKSQVHRVDTTGSLCKALNLQLLSCVPDFFKHSVYMFRLNLKKVKYYRCAFPLQEYSSLDQEVWNEPHLRRGMFCFLISL